MSTMTIRFGGAEITIDDQNVEQPRQPKAAQPSKAVAPTSTAQKPQPQPKRPKAAQPKRQPKATSSKKTLLAQIRQLVAEGDVEKALAMTPMGWIQEREAIAKKLVAPAQKPKAAQKQPKAAKAPKRPKAAQRPKADVKAVKAADVAPKGDSVAMGRPKADPKPRTSAERREAVKALTVPAAPKVKAPTPQEKAEAIIAKARAIVAEGDEDKIAESWARATEQVEALDLKIDDEPTNNTWKVLATAFADAAQILADGEVLATA